MTQIPLEHIAEIAARTAGRHGAFLTDLEMRGELRSRVLEVYVDTDEGISIDTCSEISRELSEILDEQDLIPGAYRLDVSSPDLNRPIHVPRQYKKNIGRTAAVTFRQREDNAVRTAEGILESADDEHIGVRLDKTTVLTIPLHAIEQAFIVPQLKKRQ